MNIEGNEPCHIIHPQNTGVKTKRYRKKNKMALIVNLLGLLFGRCESVCVQTKTTKSSHTTIQRCFLFIITSLMQIIKDDQSMFINLTRDSTKSTRRDVICNAIAFFFLIVSTFG